MSQPRPPFPPGTIVEVVDPHSKLYGYRATVVDPAEIDAPAVVPGALMIRVVGKPPPGTRRLWVVREAHVRAAPGAPG